MRFMSRQARITLLHVFVVLAASRPATAQDSTGTDEESAVAVIHWDSANIQLGAVAQVDLNARANEQPSGFDVWF